MADHSYTNYLSADDYDRVRHACGPDYERLVELTGRYDPDNLFRLNHNIDPQGLMAASPSSPPTGTRRSRRPRRCSTPLA